MDIFDSVYERFSKFSVSAIGFVRNKAGDVLAIRAPSDRRGWELPGGGLESDESPLDGLKREVEEETGARIKPTALVSINFNQIEHRLVFVFLAKYLEGKLTTSRESAKVEWVPASEIIERLTREKVKQRAQDCLDFDGKLMFRCFEGKPYNVLEEIALKQK